MPHPFLKHIELHATLYCMDTEAMPQPFWTGMGTRDPGRLHCALHPTVRGGAIDARPELFVFHSMSSLEHLDKVPWNRNVPELVRASTFERAERNDTGSHLKRGRSQFQGLGNPTPGIEQRQTEASLSRRQARSCLDESRAVFGVDV